MSTDQDLNILEFGTPDGHQPNYQPLESTVDLFIGQMAITRGGYLIQPDDGVQSTDTVWGILNGQFDSQEAVSSPMNGGSEAGLHTAGIATGTFYLTSGTSSDEILQDDVGKLCYAIDGNTVGIVSTSRPAAGRIASIGKGQYAGLVAVTLGNNQTTGSV